MDLLVPRRELEAVLLGEIQTRILVPENVAYVVDQTVARLGEKADGSATDLAESRVAQITRQIERLVKLAETAGDVEEIAQGIARLEEERASLVSIAQPPEALDPDEIRAAVEARLGKLCGWLSGSPEEGQRALRALLGGRRMEFGPDPELRFRVDGIFEFAARSEKRPATDGDHRASRLCGSGGGI